MIGWAVLAVFLLTEKYVLSCLVMIGVFALTYKLSQKYGGKINLFKYTGVTFLIEVSVFLMKFYGVIEIEAFYIIAIYMVMITSMLEKTAKVNNL